MISLKAKLGTGLATAGIMAASFAPAAFAADVSVSGNTWSLNTVKVKSSSKMKVKQSNTTVVGTMIGQSANTGGNSSSFNTGNGGSSITTGNATNTATVSVTGGENTLTLPENCLCEEGDTTVDVKNNVFSVNDVKVKNKKKVKIGQENITAVETYVEQQSNTGLNSSSFNTGKGGSDIESSDARNTVSVTVSSGDNDLN